MNLLEFQQFSKRTMPYGGEPSNQVEFENMLGNYAMGLVGEALELKYAGKNQVHYFEQNDLVESEKWAKKAFLELGDTLHYAIGILSLLGETVDESKIGESKKGGLFTAGDICEIAKKHIYHRHCLDYQNLIEKVYDYISNTVESLEEYLPVVLQMNIDKLKIRYPEKFSTADSIARIDVVEGKA